MGTYADPRVHGGPGRYAPSPAPEPPPAPAKASKKAKVKDPIWAKLCLIFGALVMVMSGLVAVVPRMLVNWATADIQEQLLPSDEGQGLPIDGPINLLLLGIDQRQGNVTEPIRTDTMIIVHIPATHDQVYMVSLPRDGDVEIPSFPESNFEGWRTKINAAYAFGNLKDGRPDFSLEGRQRGVKLTMQTIDNLVPGGLKFNGVAIINFEGFKAILDVIGGVHMCIDERTTSIHFDKNGQYHTEVRDLNKRKVYEVGCRDLAPYEALDFARQRKNLTGGDYARQKHQQQLIMAIFRKLTSKGVLTDPGKLLDLQKAAGDLLTLHLGQSPVADWIFTLKNIRPENIVMIKTNGGVPNPTPNGNEKFSKESMDLLKAVHDSKVYEFVMAHPTWVATEK